MNVHGDPPALEMLARVEPHLALPPQPHGVKKIAQHGAASVPPHPRAALRNDAPRALSTRASRASGGIRTREALAKDLKSFPFDQLGHASYSSRIHRVPSHVVYMNLAFLQTP